MLSYQSHNLKISVFCTILEEIPLKFPGLKISGIDQSIGLDKDCDQFAWGQLLWSPAFSDIIFLNESNLFTPTADFLFLTLKSWFYSCMHQANTVDIHFGKPPHHKAKKPILFFSLVKNFIYDLWLFRCSSCFSLVRKTIQPIRICAVYYKSFFFHI